MDLFYVASKISIGNGAKTPFWEAPWLDGAKPKDIALLIFMSSSRKRWNIKSAFHENGWIRKIKIEELTTTHMSNMCHLD
jgi:hypothetical protein